ncbi:hypothetical protein TWF694_002311 [Orbilia ellipsospora]|uniref:Uncharacterized protein n=1 Tax=Orbilia ellipsospora TaxID=2528407 RepID=A0AAV9X2Y2_9PEZI
MAEYLTQDVDPRLAQSVVESTTGADGVTTLSNAHGVEVATVVSGEEANAKFNPSNSNGFVDGTSTSDASRTDKRDDSPTGASGTESTKSTDKPAAQKVAASKKAPVVKSVSLNKAFLSGNASAPAQPGVGKLTLSLDKGPKGTGSGTAASSALAAKPRLVSKMGPSGSRMVGLGQLGGKGGNIPSVWNRNLPPAPVPAKEYTDEELSKHGIHMAERIQTEDPKEAKWADIDDDDDGWVPPDTIEWNDGTKVTLDAAETPKPIISAFEKQIGTAALKEQRGSITSQTGVPPPPPPPAVSTAQLKPMEPQQPRKPEYIPSAPPPKTPWAAVPTGSFPTPRPMPPSLQQYPGRPLPPTGRPMFVNTQHHQHQQPPKEVPTDDFSRQSWRERQSSQSPSTLFNSETGNFDPVGEANRNRDQVRRNSRAEAPGVRPTSLLQRPAGSEHEPQFQQNRFQGRPENEHHPNMGPVDMGRRRSASIRSAALSDTSSTAWDSRQQPSNINVVTEPGGAGPGISSGNVDSHPQRASQGPLYISPTVAGGDPRFGRAGPQSVPPVVPPNGVDVPQEPGENPLEAQQRVMKDAREQARARRLAEEAAQEEEKRKRIQKKLAELDEKMKAEAASKAEEHGEKEETNGQSNVDEVNGASPVDRQVSMVTQPTISPTSTTKPDDMSLPSGGTRGPGQEHQKLDSQRRVDNIPNGSHHSMAVNGGASSTYHQSHQPQSQPPSQQPSSPTATTTTTTTVTTHSQPPIHQQHQQHHPPPSSFSSHHPPTINPSSSSSSSSPSFHHLRHSPNTRFAHPSYPYHHNPSNPSNPHHPHSSNTSSSYNPQRFEHGNFRNSLPSTTPPSDKNPVSANGHQSAELPNTMNAPTVFPSTRVGDHITLKNLPLAPGKEQYFPVELPQDWKRNGIVKASPWTPTAQETHVKKFAMFLPTADKEKQTQASTGKQTWPNGQTHSNENADDRVNENEEIIDPDILISRYGTDELRKLGTNPKTMNQRVPGTITMTFEQLRYYARNAAALESQNSDLDRICQRYNEKATKEKYGVPTKQENVKEPTEATAATKEEKEKPSKQATQLSEQAKFDEITNRILNLAGQSSSFAAKYAAETPKPVWEEPVVRANDLQNWDQGGEERHTLYVHREKRKHEAELESWESSQDFHRNRNTNEKPGRITAVRPRDPPYSRSRTQPSQSRTQPPSQLRNQTSSQVDPKLQVISKPAFQGVAGEGRPKVLLPKVVNVVVAAPPPPKPELPHTLPPEEEFNDIAFQQEFGSTPTVCLPTVTPKLSSDPNAPGSGKKGKDKKRPLFRDQDMISKGVAPTDLTDGPLVAPPIVVKLPGMTTAKSFQMSSTYEGIWKAQQAMSRNQRGHHNDHRSGQHSQSGRSDSGQSRPRNSRGRGPYNSSRNH